MKRLLFQRLEGQNRMKKLICIGGTILVPLRGGGRAVNEKGGDWIYTSRVVESLSETEEAVCFETMNSVYKVSLLPVPVKAPLPSELSMCA